MDPEIVKAARTYFDQIAKAKAAGEPPTASEKEAYARQLTNGEHGYADIEALGDRLHEDGGNAVASGLQGFTANFGDEIVGMLPKFLGGGEAGKEEMRLRGDFMRREHPKGDMAMQGLGAIGSAAVLPIGGAAKGLSLAEKALQGARVGAIYGGANGVGGGENLEDRLIGGAAGTVAGAIVGEAVPHVMATRAAQAIARPIGNAVSALLPGEAAAAATPLEAGYQKLTGARSQVEKAIENLGGFAKAHAANDALAAGGRGEQAMFADLGRPTTALADFAATNSTKAHGVLADVVEQRGEASTARVLDDFKAGAGDAHAPSRQAQLAAETRAWANGPDGYGGIRAQNPSVPLGEADKLVKQPRIRQMFATAKQTGEIGPNPEDMAHQAMLDARANNPELDAFMAANPKLDVEALLTDGDAVAQLQALGKGHLLDKIKSVGGNTFDNVQDLHSSLVDAAEKAFRSGADNLAFRLKNSAGVVARTLEETIPGYAEIVDKYAARKGLERASQLGEEWFTKKADIKGLNDVVESLKDKPLLLEEFRKGLASKQIIQLQGQSGTNAATKTVIGKNNLAQQNMNKIVFGDEATYDKFMLQAKAERQLHKLADATGGSQTAGRNAAREDALGMLGAEAQRTHPTVRHALWHKAAKVLVGSHMEKRADDLLPFLTTQGHDAISEMLNALERSSARVRVGPGSTTAAPSAISSLFGNRHTLD